jgi:hypothetical protein
MIGLVLFTACVAVERPVSAPGRPEPALPEPLVTSVVTLLPGLPSTPTQEAAPQSTLQATLTPQAVFDKPARTPGQPAVQSWQDCSLAGGWIGCDPGAPPFAVRLAFFHPASQAVVVLDLESSAGWSIPSAMLAVDPRVSWSPDGMYLLVALDESRLALYGADSTPQGGLAPGQDEMPPAWQPDGTLAEPETVRSALGFQARLEQDPNQRWQVLYQSEPGTAPQPLLLETEPTDRLYHLLSFVPGTNLMLGQTYYAGNQAIMQGAQLFTLDVKNGERRDLEAMAPLGWQAAFAWKSNPQDSQAALLAFTDTGGPQVGLPTLALLDFSSGELRRPLPPGVAVADLAWQPQGGGLAFAASSSGEVTPPEAAAVYALPGIYLLAPDTGEVRALTQPPSGARDGLPTWSADGEWLLYVRYFDSGALEVHAMQPGSAGDHLIAAGLTAECPFEGPGCSWGRWIAMTTK